MNSRCHRSTKKDQKKIFLAGHSSSSTRSKTPPFFFYEAVKELKSQEQDLFCFFFFPLRSVSKSQKSRARNPTHKRKTKRPTAQREHLGATAGPSPGRSSCIRGVPGVRNAGVVGGVIHPARGFLRDEFGVSLFDLFTY